MANKTLEEQIQERIQQARDSNIAGKAIKIRNFVGGYFPKEKLSIDVRYKTVYDCPCPHEEPTGVTITYQEEKVFEESGCSIESYIPGEWEQILDNLLPKIEKVKEEIERNRFMEEKERLKEIAKKFGL